MLYLQFQEFSKVRKSIMLTSVSFSAFMDENTEKAQQQREEIPYPVTNERRLGVDNQWMTNVGSMNPILSTRRKSLQLFWATFPSDQHNVTFPLMPSFCNLWPSNETLGTKVFSWQFSVGEWWKERRRARRRQFWASSYLHPRFISISPSLSSSLFSTLTQ